MNQYSIRRSRTQFNILAIIFLIALPAVVAAQTQVADQGRTSPSAWRPSFSPIDRNAIAPQFQSQSQSQSQSQPQSQPQFQTRPRENQKLGPNTNFGQQNQRNNNQQAPPNDRFARRSPLPQPAGAAPEIRPGVTKVTRTFEKLPNAAGQVWREYDITPYTSELSNLQRPEQAVIDWIVKETGTRLWFSEPMGVLSADRKRVIVYHTPEIQRVVKTILDRFNRTRAQSQVFEINLVTVDKPNWRATAYPMLQPIEVRSPGIEAWLVSKENAAILQGQLARRADFKRHSGGRVAGPDGQTFVLEKSTPVSFTQALQWLSLIHI